MVLRGIVAVLFGLAALFWPGLTLFVLLVCFGVYAMADGLLAIVTGIRASGGRRWLLLAEGAFGFLAVYFASWPIALGQGPRALVDVAEYVRRQEGRLG